MKCLKAWPLAAASAYKLVPGARREPPGPGRDGVAKLIVIGRTQAQQPQAVGRACRGCDDVPAGGASPPLIAACARSWRIACRSSR
jgi:hypothetical protein